MQPCSRMWEEQAILLLLLLRSQACTAFCPPAVPGRTAAVGYTGAPRALPCLHANAPRRAELAAHEAPDIPTIDLSPFFSDSEPAARAEIGEQMRHACEHFGMFYVTGHGLSADQAQAALASSRDLFRLPDAQKQGLPSRKDNGFIRGYIGVGGESGSPTLFEAKETFSFGFEWGDAPPPPTLRNGLVGPNLWPSESATGLGAPWKKPLLDLFERKVAVSKAVTRALALALGRDEHSLLEMCEQGDIISIMRCFRYLPLPNACEAEGGRSQQIIGSSPHTDWGWLTVILQEPGVTALQVMHGGEWHDVAPKPGALLVNVGDYVSLMTSSRFISPLHRVVIDGHRERHSFVFFFYPSFDSSIPAMPPPTDKSRQSNYSLLKSQVKDGEPGGSPGSRVGTFGEFITMKWAEVQR